MSYDDESPEDDLDWDEDAFRRMQGSERVGTQWVSFAFPANVDAVLAASWRLYGEAIGGWTVPRDHEAYEALREEIQRGGEQALREYLGGPDPEMMLRVPSEPPNRVFLDPPKGPHGDGGTRGPGDFVAIIPIAIAAYGAATWLVGSINTWIKFGENVGRARERLSELLSRPQRISDGQAIGIAAKPIYEAAGTDQLSFAFVHPAGPIRLSEQDWRDPGFVVGFYAADGIWVAVVDPYGNVKSVAQLPMQLPPPPPLEY